MGLSTIVNDWLKSHGVGMASGYDDPFRHFGDRVRNPDLAFAA